MIFCRVKACVHNLEDIVRLLLNSAVECAAIDASLHLFAIVDHSLDEPQVSWQVDIFGGAFEVLLTLFLSQKYSRTSLANALEDLNRMSEEAHVENGKS